MRIERDSMGEMSVPDDALYGASTQRAVINFPVSGRPLPEPFIRGLGLVKQAAAAANEELGLLNREKSRLIQQIAREIADGKLTEHFPIDVFQTGSATSTNMNANEVIANRASQLAGQPIGSKIPLHPNDDVNLGQSSNDVIPTVLHVSVAVALQPETYSRAHPPRGAARAKSGGMGPGGQDWPHPLDGRHAVDPRPGIFRLREAGEKGGRAVRAAIAALGELAIGGTAVGTGINTDVRFGKTVARILSTETGLAFREAENHFEAQGARDDCVEVAGQLVAIAAGLTKIANDIRWLGSGPRAGLAELKLVATQPGSSIMPGKVNPVMSEMLV